MSSSGGSSPASSNVSSTDTPRVIIYNGTQQRKPVERKTIDYYAVVAHAQLDRHLYRDHRDRPAIDVTTDGARDMPCLAHDAGHNPTLGVCTRYIASSTNKTRTAITACAWTPDGLHLVTGSQQGELTQWNGLQFNFEGIVSQAHEKAAIHAMVWTRNELVMVTADEFGVCKYWQPSMNNCKAFQAHKEAIRDISISPSDTQFVSCGDDQTLCAWDLVTATLVRRVDDAHELDVCAARWHPSRDVVLTCSKDKTIKLWDLRAPEACVSTIRDAHKDIITRAAWSPLRDDWFATTSHDGSTKVFDVRTLRSPSSAIAHQAGRDQMEALTWHPTIDRLLATASRTGNIHHWAVDQAPTQGTISGAHDKTVNTLAWHPLGHLLASVSLDCTTRFWARNRPGDDLTDKYNANALHVASSSSATSSILFSRKPQRSLQR